MMMMMGRALPTTFDQQQEEEDGGTTADLLLRMSTSSSCGLSQPAQRLRRPPRRVGFGLKKENNNNNDDVRSSTSSSAHPATIRGSIPAKRGGEKEEEDHPKTADLKKQAIRHHRDTVYIRADDHNDTMAKATAFMGMFSPLGSQQQQQQQLEDPIIMPKLLSKAGGGGHVQESLDAGKKKKNDDDDEKENMPLLPPSYAGRELLQKNARAIGRPALADKRGNNQLTTSGIDGKLSSGQKKKKKILSAVDQKYPLLTEDISHPSMYEDNWLFHQEIAITQLVNELFERGQQHLQADADTLRRELLSIYQSDYFVRLHSRLQASLQCGSLSVPKYHDIRSRLLKRDVGFRRKFLDMWIKVYDPVLLRAAAETIFGRKLLLSSTRELEGFLDTLLVQNEDADYSYYNASTYDKEYARTVLRSIMMVVLLDRWGSQVSARRLIFKDSSPYKSSLAVVQALGRLLVPSCGDIGRTLGHLECRVVYEQSPLREYDYRIANLAVDLRDGVRLTRMVELLFFHGEEELSRRLRFPCPSRATKLFNVQVVLEALGGGRDAVVRPEDIVDGHREKSVALLWRLLMSGGWGLGGLVDWDDLRSEIGRLSSSSSSSGVMEKEEGKKEHVTLLVRWASILAGMKGIPVENLTTSFADGRIYESIVDEYEGYIVLMPGGNNNSNNNNNMGTRLEALGCSSQFGEYPIYPIYNKFTNSISIPGIRTPDRCWRPRLHHSSAGISLLPTPLGDPVRAQGPRHPTGVAKGLGRAFDVPTHGSSGTGATVCGSRADARSNPLG